MKTRDEEVKRYAVGVMEQRGSFEYSRRWIGELRGRAEGLVEEVERGVEGLDGGGGKEGEGKGRLGDGVRRILEGMDV